MANWETRSVQSYTSTNQTGEVDAHVIASDPIRVDKTHRKLKAFIVQRGVNGIPSFTQLWHALDNQEWDQNLTIWEFKRFLQTVEIKLDSKDIEVLFIHYDYDADGELDYDDFLLGVRNNIDMSQQQMEDIVKKFKTKLSTRFKGENLRTVLLQRLSVFDTNTLNKGQYIEALSSLHLNVSRSEMLFLFSQLHENADGIEYIDAEVLADFILEEVTHQQMIGDIHCKMVESLKDRDRPTSGSVGLLRVLKRIDTDDTNVLSQEQFKRGMKGFGCSLLDKEIDHLFEFYMDQATRDIVLPDFIHSIRTEMGSETPIEWIEYLTNRLCNILTHRGAHGIVQLKQMCDKHSGCSNGTLTLRQWAAAVRDVGVGGSFPDIDLEVVYNHFSETLDSLPVPVVLAAIRGTIPPQRLTTIQQAWDKIDVDKAGVVSVDDVLNIFVPAKLPEVQSRKISEKDAFQEFSDAFSNGDGMVSKQNFIDYWSNVSPSIADGNEFCLSLWYVFELNRGATRHQKMLREARLARDQQQNTRNNNSSPTESNYSQQSLGIVPTIGGQPQRSPTANRQQQQQSLVRTPDRQQQQQLPTRTNHQRGPAARRRGIGGAGMATPSIGDDRSNVSSGEGPSPNQSTPSPTQPNSPSPYKHSPSQSPSASLRSSPKQTLTPASLASMESNTPGGRNKRFAHSQGHGGGHQTLNLFGGGGSDAQSIASAKSGKSISRAGKSEMWKGRPW